MTSLPQEFHHDNCIDDVKFAFDTAVDIAVSEHFCTLQQIAELKQCMENALRASMRQQVQKLFDMPGFKQAFRNEMNNLNNI